MRATAVIATGFALAAALAARGAFAADSAPKSAPVVAPPAEAPAVATPPAGSPSGRAVAPATAAPTVVAAAGEAPAASAPAATPPVAPVVQPSARTAPAHAGALREPAPRPATDVRVQSRFAVKAKSAQLFGAAEYLSRGDFYNSPGARVGATYYPLESLGLELQISHYWSSLNAEAERVKRMFGGLPDSHAPAWVFLAGGRYSIGYGKLMVGGLGGAIHFEPQAFIHAGMHAYEGDVGLTADAGLGFLVFLTPKMFVRIDAAIVYDREDRSGTSVSVWGTSPSLGLGGTL